MEKLIYLVKHGGSLEHPWHFWHGYFLPMVFCLTESKELELTVRDCGPMTPWLDLLSNTGFSIEIQKPGLILNELGKGANHIFEGPYDNTDFIVSHEFIEQVDRLKSVFELQRKITSERGILIQRFESPDFYSKAAEIKGAGESRRSITNSAELLKVLSERADFVGFSGWGVDPLDQLRLFSTSSTLIGQWGAGLSNMIWMPKGSSIIEISSPQVMRQANSNLYKIIANALGHKFTRVFAQTGLHSRVDVESVASELNSNDSGFPHSQSN